MSLRNLRGTTSCRVVGWPSSSHFLHNFPCFKQVPLLMVSFALYAQLCEGVGINHLLCSNCGKDWADDVVILLCCCRDWRDVPSERYGCYCDWAGCVRYSGMTLHSVGVFCLGWEPGEGVCICMGLSSSMYDSEVKLLQCCYPP